VRDLYEILIDIVQSVLPHSVPPQRGYEAIIGMLNWVMPLDVDRALRVLLSTFYKTVCKQCLPGVQTPEYIGFRTRHSLALQGEDNAETDLAEHFPFDQALLRPYSSDLKQKPEAGAGAKKEGIADRSEATSKKGLLRDVVITLSTDKPGMRQTFEAQFGPGANVELL
jgi:hypothetical protein